MQLRKLPGCRRWCSSHAEKSKYKPRIEKYRLRSKGQLLRRRPSAGDSNPLIQAASLLTLNIHNVRITLASASDPVFLDRVPSLPVIVFLLSPLLIESGHFEKRFSGQLAIAWSVCRAMLDRSMAVSNIAEIMNISGR